jgi:dUTP pyrophosphatase
MCKSENTGEKPNFNIQLCGDEIRYPRPHTFDLWPTIKIRKINEKAKTPEKKSLGAAAYDLYAAEKVLIRPNSVKAIGIGLVFEIPMGYKGEIYSRSGLALKGIFVANQPGKIDSDYRGQVKVLLYNSTSDSYYVDVGDRIAQFEIQRVTNFNFFETTELSDTDRGDGGMGSTGK